MTTGDEAPEQFFLALVTLLETLFPDYSVEPFGDTPTRAEDCPRLCVQYLGDERSTSTGTRDRIWTGRTTIVGSFHRWIDAPASRKDLASQLLREYGRNIRLLGSAARTLRLEKRLPEGVQITGPGELKAKTFQLPANCQSTVISSSFLIQGLPIQFPIAEDA